MTTQEMIDVLKAYQEGKEIEVKYITSDDNDWIITAKPSFNFNMYEYRVKPEYKLRRFKLIEEYPASPSLGTIVEFKTEQDFNIGISNVAEIGRLTLDSFILYPEFWEEIVEEKIYTYEDDLVGRKCIYKTENIVYTIISKIEKKLSLKSSNENPFQVSYENFNKYYKLC